MHATAALLAGSERALDYLDRHQLDGIATTLDGTTIQEPGSRTCRRRRRERSLNPSHLVVSLTIRGDRGVAHADRVGALGDRARHGSLPQVASTTRGFSRCTAGSPASRSSSSPATWSTLLFDSYAKFRLRGSSWSRTPARGDRRRSPWASSPSGCLVAVEVTALAMKKLSKRWWRNVHIASYFVFWAVSIHAALAGTDTSKTLYTVTAIVALAAVVFAASYRALSHRPAETQARCPEATSALGDDRQRLGDPALTHSATALRSPAPSPPEPPRPGKRLRPGRGASPGHVGSSQRKGVGGRVTAVCPDLVPAHLAGPRRPSRPGGVRISVVLRRAPATCASRLARGARRAPARPPGSRREARGSVRSAAHRRRPRAFRARLTRRSRGRRLRRAQAVGQARAHLDSLDPNTGKIFV